MNNTTHNTREQGIEDLANTAILNLIFSGISIAQMEKIPDWLLESIEKNKTKFQETIHQELQKAREEERERIEAVFKEHVPPHAMDLEDSVWLKRLLNKAFYHENLY